MATVMHYDDNTENGKFTRAIITVMMMINDGDDINKNFMYMVTFI